MIWFPLLRGGRKVLKQFAELLFLVMCKCDLCWCIGSWWHLQLSVKNNTYKSYESYLWMLERRTTPLQPGRKHTGGSSPTLGVKRSVDRWQRQVNQLRRCYSVKLLMEETLPQLRLVIYPIIYKVSYIPGGVGFLPSTVSLMIRCSCIRHRSIHIAFL